jgi:hypothetical protein
MDTEQAFPVVRQTVLDTTDPRRLAEFYRQLFGLRYRPGDEPPGPGKPDPKGQDWLVLKSPASGAALAFQKVGELPEATWPDGPVPQQLHLDTTVPTAADLDVQHERALALGARLLKDRSDDPEHHRRSCRRCGWAKMYALLPEAVMAFDFWLARIGRPLLLRGPGSCRAQGCGGAKDGRSKTSTLRWIFPPVTVKHSAVGASRTAAVCG